MAENIFTATDAKFDEEVVKADKAILVDFWADWCTPCHMVAPVVEEISNEKAADLKVAKLNVDENPETARKFGVMSIPTLILFKNGEEKARLVGARGKDAILQEIDPHIAA